MKFIIAVVILALAVANASVLPYAYSPYGVPLSYAPGISLSQGISGLAYSAGPVLSAPYAYNLPSAYNLGSVAVAAPVAYHAPAPVAVAAPLVPSAASYVATTRGGQHVAPLPGHVQSVASTNVQPAPGTL